MQLRSGKSNYVHDPLHVRAFAFQNGDGRAVIALMDAIGVGREMCDEAKAKAATATGWKPEEMLVCGTHTHSAPKGGDTSPGRIAYEKTRREGLAKALQQAIESLQPAKVGFASDEEASEVRNRRWIFKPGSKETMNPLGTLDTVRTNGGGPNQLEPAGPIDPEVAVIDVRNLKNRSMGPDRQLRAPLCRWNSQSPRRERSNRRDGLGGLLWGVRQNYAFSNRRIKPVDRYRLHDHQWSKR